VSKGLRGRSGKGAATAWKRRYRAHSFTDKLAGGGGPTIFGWVVNPHFRPVRRTTTPAPLSAEHVTGFDYYAMVEWKFSVFLKADFQGLQVKLENT
jgi:hypothetical protein